MRSMKDKFTLPPGNRREKVEDFLRSYGISHNLFIELYKKNCIAIDGVVCGRNGNVEKNSLVSIAWPKESIGYVAKNQHLTIRYEDDHCLIVEKPAGIVMHHDSMESLANGIAYLLEERGAHRKVRFVNRLDRDTTGLVMIALHPFSQHYFQKQMESGVFRKFYTTIIHGIPKEKKGIIELPLKQNLETKRYEVYETGKRCATAYEVLRSNDLYSEVRVELLTGRTHQIRAHFAALGHPLFGDSLYGSGEGDGGQMLHAGEIEFHPLEGECVTHVTCSLPPEFRFFFEGRCCF